jgi:hypothetical protein
MFKFNESENIVLPGEITYYPTFLILGDRNTDLSQT